MVLPDGSRLSIPAEWTEMQGYEATHTGNSLGSVEDLLRSRRVVDALQRRLAGNVSETANLEVESACANEAELHGGRPDSARIGVGSIGQGAETRRHRNTGAAGRQDDCGENQSGAQE